MNQEEINKWIMDNNLKVSYQEQYDEQIKLGDIIETNVKENDIITYRDKFGMLITHRIIGIDGQNIITKGVKPWNQT